MPSAAVSRIRARIGDLGLPGVVWGVVEPNDVMVAFYDREKAETYARLDERRVFMTSPLTVRDAFER